MFQRVAVHGVLVVLAVAMSVAIGAAPTRAQTPGCDALFPDHVWSGTRRVGPVSVFGADVTSAELGRFADQITDVVDLIEPEIGHLAGTSVCLFGATVPLDPAAFVPLGQRVHALALTTERAVVIEALDPRQVQRAAGFGLAYLALADLGPEPYPEPLGYAVGQWYVSRVENKVELHHNVMSRVSFFEGTSGTNWLADVQEPTYSWNPQFQESPIGDIIDFAVRTEGLGAITDPKSVDWDEVEAAWVADIELELLGRSGSTTGWIFGFAFFLGMITLAVVMGLVARRNKRIRRGPSRVDTPVVG